jgi:transposase
MLNSNRFRNNATEQGQLLPTYISDLIAEEHPARMLSAIVDNLDLSSLYCKYGWEGGETFHPKSILKVIFYGYSQSTRSSRKISQACRENVVYMYVSGGIRPDFRTISLFRKNNLDVLKDIFKQIVTLSYELGMISFGTISIDGTKVRANVSRHRSVSSDKLDQEIESLDEEIGKILREADELDAEEDQKYGELNEGPEVPEKLKTAQKRKEAIGELIKEMKGKNVKQMNLTDKDSRLVRSKGRYEFSYNGQCATENQVILNYHLTNQEADIDQLIPMVEGLEAIARPLNGKEEYPLEGSKIITDSGYDSGKNLSHLKDRKSDGYVANQMSSVYEKEKSGEMDTRPFTKDKFSYQETDDQYVCPMGERLYPVERRTSKRSTYIRHEVRYKGQSCRHCRHQSECARSKDGKRQICRILEYDPYREEIDNKLRTDEGKKIYRKRQSDIEPVFGQMKLITFGHACFLLRGFEKASGEFGLACIVHNIRKIISHLKSSENEGVLPEINRLTVKMAT